MNKAIYICAVAMVLASCSNDEIVERAKGNAISFRSVVGLNTRATEATVDNLKAINVTAYHGTELYLDNVEYKKDDTGFFNSANPYLWPATGELTFTVFSDNWTGTREFTSSTEQWMRNVTINEDIAKQEDMTYVTNVTGTKADNEKTGLELTLKHALVQVQINAKNKNGNYVYKVKGLRLNNVVINGDFDFKNEHWGAYNGNDLRIKTFEVTYDTPIDLTADAKPIMGTAGNAMVIPCSSSEWNGTLNGQGSFEVPLTADAQPQASTIEGGFFSVLVNIQTKAGASVYPNKAGGYAWVAIPVVYDWAAKQGYKLIYTLDFSNGAGRVDPVDPGTDWDAANDPAKAQPILGGAINLDVTVKAWDAETGSDVELD